NEMNFPISETRLDRNQYQQILQKFEQDMKVIGETLNLNNALLLYEKYTSFVPALTLGVYGQDRAEVLEKHPDISLYDHSRIAVNLANCLWNYFETNSTYAADFKNNVLLEEAILNRPDENRFLLIGGDFSGIQNFIYTISSWRALRNLKSRSFFLELLTEHVIRRLLQELDLSYANTIYSGGGRFYIMAQNNQQAWKTVELVREQINTWLFKEFKGKLALNLTGVLLSDRTLLEWDKPGTENLTAVWQKLAEQLEKQKSTRFSERLEELFKPIETVDQTRQCEVCHRDDIELQPYYDPVEGEEERHLCPMCWSLTKFGGELFRIKFIELKDNETSKRGIKIEDTWFVPMSTVPEHGPGLVINSLNLHHFKVKDRASVWLGNYTGLQRQDSVNHYAQKSYGENRLGVLRMDVDRLGQIFIRGLHPEDASFSRHAALSRALGQFFKVGINILCSKRSGRFNPLQKNAAYMVAVAYSGGDDLFILGAWDEVLEVAVHINQAFRAYTCRNPDITLSAGVVVQHPKIPVYQLATLSAAAEEASKENDRDSVTLFYDPTLPRTSRRPARTWKWEVFLERVQPIIEELLDFGQVKDFNGGKKFEPYLSKAFIFRMLQLVEQIGANGKLVLPRMAWALARMEKALEGKLKTDNRLKNLWLEAIKNRFLGYDTLEYLEVPLIWLDLISRTRGGE
ncbi:MAG: type III-A CRISPR-associated protein Cas10/Csm1, partial [bacterium]